MAKRLLPVGIDDMAFYVPKLYLDIRTLAEKRNIIYEKLSQGLGLYKMAVCDVHGASAAFTLAPKALWTAPNLPQPTQLKCSDSGLPTATGLIVSAIAMCWI